MFFCPACAEGFDYESWLTRHVKDEHPMTYINMMAQRELELERGERKEYDD